MSKYNDVNKYEYNATINFTTRTSTGALTQISYQIPEINGVT